MMGCTVYSNNQLEQSPSLNHCTPDYFWSELKQRCVSPITIADVHLTDPEIPTSNLHILFAEEQGKAESFSINPFQHMLLDAVKGGYMTRDKKLFLIKMQSGWEIKKRATLKNTK